MVRLRVSATGPDPVRTSPAPALRSLSSVATILLTVLFWVVGLPETSAATSDATLAPDVAAAIDGVFAELDRTDSPGCALGVIREGELVYTRGYGMASLEHGMPIDETTVFYVGSVSKQFVAAAVARAARDGHFSLDDDLRSHFPELPEYAGTVTVRQMVHHTSGLRDYLQLMAISGRAFENVFPSDGVLELIARQQALNFPAGTRHLYSNSGYFLLAQLVERATGQTLREYAEEKFFGPLGMRQTHFHDDRREVVRGRALAYSPAPDGYPHGDFVVGWSPAFEQVGSGGLLTSVADLVEWDRSYYDQRLGSDFWSSLEQKGRLADGEELDYAFGLTVDTYRGERRIQHGGAMFGYRAQLMRFPDRQLSIACLCNLSTTNPTRLAERAADPILSAMGLAADASQGPAERVTATPVAIAMDPDELRRFVGEYELDGGFSLLVELRDDALVMTGPGGRPERLDPVAQKRFRIAGSDGEVRFLRRLGRTRGLEIERSGSTAPTTADRAADLELDREELVEWVGDYWSDELAVWYRVEWAAEDAEPAEGELSNTPLVLHIASEPPVPLRVRKDDTFGTSTGSGPALRVGGKKRGELRGFLLDSGRVQGLRFEKGSRGLGDEAETGTPETGTPETVG